MRNFILVLLLIFACGVVYFLIANSQSINKINKENQCTYNRGKWLKNYSECELRSLTEQEGTVACKTMGGKYTYCTSECRHNSQAAMCTANCVSVCKF